MLPNTYWQLEYIQSDGNQYINTGLSCANINTYKMVFEMATATSNYGDDYRFTMNNSSNRWVAIIPYNATNYKLQLGGASTERNIAVDSVQNFHTITLDLVNSYGQVDDTQQALTNSTNSISGNIILFGRNDNGSYSGGGRSKLKSGQIYQNGTLVRNFIPAIRISDMVVGLYDDVNDVFYTNAGSGTFIAGAIINAPLNITFDDNPLSFGLSESVSLIANFKISYQITLTYDSSLGSASYSWYSGSQVQLVATPNANAQFKGWYVNSNPISIDSTYIYSVVGDVTIEARFEEVYAINDSVSGNGAIQYTRGTDQNDVTFSVIADTNNHFVKYEVDGVEYTTTPLSLHLTQAVNIVAYFEEDDRYHITVKTDFQYGSFYISDNDVFSGTVVTVWARPFPDYNFVRWEDGELSNPRQITVTENVNLVAIYQRTFETNGIYQYRCYIKDQLDLEAPPKAFMVVDTFGINVDLLTNATSTIQVMKMMSDVDEGDILVLYDPMGTTLYTGVINSIEDRTINCSQMQSFYKGTWIYNVKPQDYLEHEIALLLQDYADGKLYRSSYVDPLVAQRLGGITIDYVGTTSVNLPTDLDDEGNEQMTTKDMEEFIYELYEKYSIEFEFEINVSGRNYVHIRVPSFETIKVGNNMYAIKNMSPITEIEETNKLVIYAQDKTYRTTYIATKNEIVEAPALTTNRFNITNTEVVFSDDPVEDLIASNLPSQMFNHKVTFTLIIRNFLYEFGDFNLGGELDIYYDDDYFNSVLTGYGMTKQSNQNITEVNFVCGKVRTALTKMLTMGKV